jgi:hypothetical protein
MSNYMLYNFHDSPADLFQRMRLNVALNEELGIRIWSFPMRYQPTDQPDRRYVGERWRRYQLRSMQIILQATHGVVSGDPIFFKRAFGDDVQQFEDLLLRPHHYIFNRDWYEKLKGKAEFCQYTAQAASLTPSERTELLRLLSSCDPREFALLPSQTDNQRLRAILRFYRPLSKRLEREIWTARSRAMKQPAPEAAATVPDDERVEDAGLNDEELTVKTHTRRTAATPQPASAIL